MAKDYIVTPWEVKGDVDYGKILNEFGISKIDSSLMKRFEDLAKKKGMKMHHYLKRGIFFAHRDLKFALDEHGKGNLFLYTGCGPSGPIHMGHAMVWLFVKWLQDLLDVDI